VGCYVWYSKEETGRIGAPLSPLLGVPNVTAHPSTASVPITVLLYGGPLLCGFNVAIKGLINIRTVFKFVVKSNHAAKLISSILKVSAIRTAASVFRPLCTVTARDEGITKY